MDGQAGAHLPLARGRPAVGGAGAHNSRRRPDDDALRVKGNKVVTAIFELSGAACPAFAAHRRKIARQVKEGGAAARDNTAYSPNPKNTRNFLTHHTQRQALAATRANAKHMLIEADALKAHALLYHTSGAARANVALSATI